MNPSLSALDRLAADTRTVARAMALLWTYRPRTASMELLRALGWKSSSGKAFTHELVKLGQQELGACGLLVEQAARQGYVRLEDEARTVLYRELLDGTPMDELRDGLWRAEKYSQGTAAYSNWPLWEVGPTVAVIRLALLSGTPAAELNQMKQQIMHRLDWGRVLSEAFIESLDTALLARVDPTWRWSIVYGAVENVCRSFDPEWLPIYRWGLEQLAVARSEMPDYLRLQFAEALLLAGERARVVDLLRDEDSGAADALRAATRIQEGRWAEGQVDFEAALKRRQAEFGAKKRLLPETLAWFYVLALLAQQTPKHLERARKFCIGESGSRSPSPFERWGVWVHATGVRLGECALDPDVFKVSAPHPSLDGIWRVLARAWLGPETIGRLGAKAAEQHAAGVAALRKRLRACGHDWLDGQVAAGEAVFVGGEAPGNFFVGGAGENWRTVLASLQALGAETPGDARATRLVWAIDLDKLGGIETIEPFEQKRGPRGWGKPKPLSLAKLAGNERLEPWDASVARAIRQDSYSARRYVIDRALAIVALIGHPAVVMADAPDTRVDVVEGTPELEVIREGDRYVMRVTPPVRGQTARKDYDYFIDADEKREQEALRQITVVRESPQRVRVIRLTPAQRRAAQLVSGRFKVPAAAHAELQQTLQSLAPHFHIQSDSAEAAREVPAETRLRAELAPQGEALTLRLVVAPLGLDGPRLVPGEGRPRVMAAVKGESIGAVRDLDAERAHLDAVLEAVPFLAVPRRGDAVCEWIVEDPEQALAMVETLHAIPAIAAVDWPRGQQVRVLSVDAAHLTVKVSTARDWFSVKGEAHLDEGLVFKLEELLAAAAGKSRFVPMGKGVYAALTRELQERLADLAAVAETDSRGVRIPTLAAGWLDAVLEGAQAETDGEFRAKAGLLEAARDRVVALPAGLQAELRPYQEDGFVWAMRLAQAGFGACLADDMGLGKTLQALAVMLARAEGGPSLIVAPTSVCGNWLAETRRFAPALNPVVFGEGDRTTVVESAGPHDVVIVSYTLMQQAQERFASRTWHTVVADEAQAVKNAAAKRSLALFELPADFRMALSGTPVENRLAELWSIMRYCNPGLLGTLSRFNERFASPIERGHDREAQRRLRRLIAPFVLRRTKAQVLDDLPPRTELVLSIAPEADEAAHYEALRRQAVAAAESALGSDGAQARFSVLAQLTKLRRAACDPRLASPEFGIVGAKLRAFTELAQELAANGHKALVFSQFVDFLTLLREPLDACGIRYQYLDGATPAAERSRRVEAFQRGDGELFLISLKAGGFGLNLTAADYVVITDPWWNPAAEDQAMGRAHRIGQQRPVTVYRLVARGTLEERIVELHHDKRALAEGVLGEGGEGAAVPSTEELMALMRGD
ncbi:MAG: SNF2-related protein [Gammaproteobacteria bacterium]